ncbi:DNA topoisomerase [Mortierella sp. GBA35]|nr:DNA topoisomerase [Mortierella sp. GBA35]
MRILCVAEKHAIAKSVAQILSDGHYQSRESGDQYTRNLDFTYRLPNNTMTQIVMTSVRGHLCGTDFPDQYRKWGSCAPVQLFELNIEKKPSADLAALERNLANEARNANQVMIWTDCDREGENIGAEVAQVCRRSNPRIVVTRARFSSVTPAEIHRAMQNPAQLDQRQVDAVDARMELDLRVGASFTRFQTLSFQDWFPDLKDGVVSYGPCQFPTLGFVVDQYRRVENFIPESFWKLELKHNKDGVDANFVWQRGHLFDQLACLVIYESCMETPGPTVRISTVKSKPTSKYKPLPLTTVELQKSGSRLLSMSSDRIMAVAETLYTQGWISYPRTETDQFDQNYNLMVLVEKQVHNGQWGRFAQRLTEGGFRNPRKGKENDQAHPPIHPVMHTENLAGEEKKVYEYITRRFLACCAEDAKGDQTDIEAVIHTETFKATGLIIKERNYLDVYPYDKWSGTVLPNFEEGEEFVPTEFMMKHGATARPTTITESQLIALMHKNGIGTDATIADHIKTIISREYVVRHKQGNEYQFTPSTLGIALVEGYDNIGLDMSLSKPFLRSQLERNLSLICLGTKTKQEVVDDGIEMYRNVFEIVNRDKRILQQALQRYLRDVERPPAAPRQQTPRNAGGQNGGGGDGGGGGGGGGNGGGGGSGGSGGGGGGKRGQVFSPKPVAAFVQPNQQQHQPLPSRQVGSVMDVFRENLGSGNAADSKPRCACGLVAKEVSSTKNNGRMFLACSKHQTSACKFFAWVDEINPAVKSGPWTAGTAGQPQAPQQYSAAFMSDKQCFKCHQVGHFSSSCTSTATNYGNNNTGQGSRSYNSTSTTNQRSGSSSKGTSKSTSKRTTKSGIPAARVSKKTRPI